MDENEKLAIKALVELKNHLLVWKSSGKRVKRVALGYVKLAGKVWRTREVFSVLMEDAVDRRISASFEMARSLPEMEITRSDAKALGLKVYRTGRPCFKGHVGWRFVSNGACITCKGLLR
jgi:hypothetical protein